MTIYSYLKKDHEKVAILFEDIIKTSSDAKRDTLFIELKKELIVHADAEHATFYKSLKKHEETKELAMHADKEHAEVKAYLSKLSEIPSKNNQWMVLLGELKYAVEHHVKEEERDMFAKAKKVLDKETEAELLKQMEAFKEKELQST